MKRQYHFSVIIGLNAEKTIKHWELDLFFILPFSLFGDVRTHPTHPLLTGLRWDEDQAVTS